MTLVFIHLEQMNRFLTCFNLIRKSAITMNVHMIRGGLLCSFVHGALVKECRVHVYKLEGLSCVDEMYAFKNRR